MAKKKKQSLAERLISFTTSSVEAEAPSAPSSYIPFGPSSYSPAPILVGTSVEHLPEIPQPQPIQVSPSFEQPPILGELVSTPPLSPTPPPQPDSSWAPDSTISSMSDSPANFTHSLPDTSGVEAIVPSLPVLENEVPLSSPITLLAQHAKPRKKVTPASPKAHQPQPRRPASPPSRIYADPQSDSEIGLKEYSKRRQELLETLNCLHSTGWVLSPPYQRLMVTLIICLAYKTS